MKKILRAKTPLMGPRSEFVVWIPLKNCERNWSPPSHCSFISCFGLRNCYVCTLPSPSRVHLSLPGVKVTIPWKWNLITSLVNKIRPREKSRTSPVLWVCVSKRVCLCCWGSWKEALTNSSLAYFSRKVWVGKVQIAFKLCSLWPMFIFSALA